MMTASVRDIKNLIKDGDAVDITLAGTDEQADLVAREGYLAPLAYAYGACGKLGALYRGRGTGTLYAIAGRSLALFLFT